MRSAVTVDPPGEATHGPRRAPREHTAGRRPLDLVVLASGERVAVTVDIGTGATLGDLRRALVQALGADSHAQLVLETGPTLDATPAHEAALRTGATVGLDTPVPVVLPPLTTTELAVVGGLSGGARADAPAGAALGVGRDHTCALRVGDAEVSRRHAQLRPDSEGGTLADAGSRNGTTWRGTRIDGPVHISTGDVARLGETVVTLRPTPVADQRLEPTTDGHLRFNRPPRLHPPDAEHELVVPTEPEEPRARRFPLAAVLLPIALAGIMLAVWPGSRLYLVFLVLSPVMLVANAISDRRSGRKDYRDAKAKYDEALATVRARRADLLVEEERLTRVSHPDPTAVVAAATTPTARLWERRPGDPDFLRLRLGLADLPARLRVRPERATDRPVDDGPAADLLDPVAHDVPVVVDVGSDRVLGLAGARTHVLSLARAVLAQAVTLHAPKDLGVVLLAGRDRASDWEWASWLPHTSAPAGHDANRLVGTDGEQAHARVAELRALVEDRRAARRSELAASPTGRRWLVVLDGARGLRDVTGLAELLQDGPDLGVHFLCVDDEEAALPAECGATAVVHRGAGTRLTVRRGGTAGVSVVPDVLADGLAASTADRLARALAPVDLLAAAEDGSDLPASARFLDLVGEKHCLDADAVLDGWRRGGRSTTALLGVGPDGPLTVDLRRDGPHALVAGTSGAGKSELLQTLIASLALGNRPDALSFVLVDYKGGSAFKEAANLPHCAGLVTDLDEHLVDRALASLTAELKRRERVLAAAGAKDIDELWTMQDRGQLDANKGDDVGDTQLPRLVIVIDEFASLVEEVPDFVRGVVGIGMRGRSLGVHVVLATQRPAGVVSGEIRANVNLRIALRVTSAGDSTDVVDSPDAARISKRMPGRAYLRTGHGELTAFQTARVGWPTNDGAVTEDVITSVRAIRRDVTTLGAPRRTSVDLPIEEDGNTDLGGLVRAVGAAAARLDSRPARSPWLPPLPGLVTLDELTPAADPAESGAATVLGLGDQPGEQAQRPFVLDLERTGSVLVAGAVRSGRSTALRTIAAGLAAERSPADLHLYALDCGNRALASLADLPHCGAVVDGDDSERVERLLATLDAEVAARQRTLGACGYASVAEARAAAPDVPLAQIVVLVDRLEAFLARFVEHDAGRLVDRLERLLRQGPAVGVTFVLAADRTGVTSRISSAVAARLVLRQANSDDVAVFGLAPRDVPADMPAGRGIWVTSGEEVQVALLDPDPAGVAQVDAVRRAGAEAVLRWAGVDARHLPRRVDPLPDQLSLSELEALRVTPAPDGSAVCVVAAGGDTLGPIDVDLADVGPCFVVAGPSRSGRSTALAAMVRSLAARPGSLPVVLVTPRPSPLRDLADLPGVAEVVAGGPDLAADLEDALSAYDGRLVLVVDDAELVTEGAEGALLDEVVRTAGDSGTVVIAAATTDDLLLNRYRGWLPAARRCRSGLLLAPQSATVGEVFDLRLPRGGAAAGPVGRGLLVRRGAWAPVQVAQP